MWTMNQWAQFPYPDRMKKIIAARRYEPFAWSFAKPLFREGEKQPSEEELVEMAKLAIAGDMPSPPKPKKKRSPVKRSRKKGSKNDRSFTDATR